MWANWGGRATPKSGTFHHTACGTQPEHCSVKPSSRDPVARSAACFGGSRNGVSLGKVAVKPGSDVVLAPAGEAEVYTALSGPQ